MKYCKQQFLNILRQFQYSSKQELYFVIFVLNHDIFVCFQLHSHFPYIARFASHLNFVLALKHLYQGRPTFFEPKAILTHQKYWWAKQIKHPNFFPKIVVIFKKETAHYFESYSDFLNFIP